METPEKAVRSTKIVDSSSTLESPLPPPTPPQTVTKEKSKLQQALLKSPKRKKGEASPKRDALSRSATRKRKREVL